MDGSDSLMHHWDHLHTLLSAISLLFAFLALRASKKLKTLSARSAQSAANSSMKPTGQLAQLIPISSAQTASVVNKSQQHKQQPEDQAQRSEASQLPEDHAEVAQLLTLMQQHARLFDFVSEEITHFSDQQVGAVARVLHSGLQKVLHDCIRYAPILTQAEQDSVQVAVGFDARRIRLQGQINHNGPYQGQLIHGGWQLNAVTLPTRGADYQASILQAAEVEV